jgi:FixJ family two-component response regulator
VSEGPLIAVIDDDQSFQAALVELLCSLAYEVRGFASAEEFAAAGMADPYACIITDIHMPGMSGFDLKRLLASRGCRVPLIMVTAGTDPGLEGKAMSRGAIGLLRKPFEASALIGCLERALKV